MALGVIRRALARLSAEGWTPNLVVSLVFALLGPAIGVGMRTRSAIVYGTATGVTIIVWVLAYFVAQAAREPGSVVPALSTDPVNLDDLEKAVREEATRSPRNAITMLSPAIERELRSFTAATGFHHRASESAIP
jgi:hypothetical protein